MKLPEKKQVCCGCGSCQAACPADAIKMIADEEGFLYPKIDQDKCVECGKCKRACAFTKSRTTESNVKAAYAVKHKKDTIRLESRSGGIFSAITDWVLNENGIVYGAILDEANTVKHIRCSTPEERNRCRGSKYVQSKIDKKIYLQLKSDLLAGRNVVFSGTACQIDAMKNYIPAKLKENLICIDIVCHGVASPLIFKDYIQHWEERTKSKVISIDFRNKKKYGWESHVETVYFEKGKVDSGIFAEIYGQHNILRPSCYGCPYKNTNRIGDITIGDFWGIHKAAPGFSDNKGVSLVYINSEKGSSIFEYIQSDLIIKKVTMADSLQPELVTAFGEPETREEFWKEYKRNGFDFVVSKYANKAWKRIPKYILKKLLLKIGFLK